MLYLLGVRPLVYTFFFFFNDTATTEIYTLSLHDALPISRRASPGAAPPSPCAPAACRRRTSGRVTAPRRGVRVDDLAPPVPDHPLDLEGHRQRSHVLVLREEGRLPRTRPLHRAGEVEDLELQRVVLVHLDVLDEGGAAVADRLPAER